MQAHTRVFFITLEPLWEWNVSYLTFQKPTDDSYLKSLPLDMIYKT